MAIATGWRTFAEEYLIVIPQGNGVEIGRHIIDQRIEFYDDVFKVAVVVVVCEYAETKARIISGGECGTSDLAHGMTNVGVGFRQPSV